MNITLLQYTLVLWLTVLAFQLLMLVKTQRPFTNSILDGSIKIF